MNIPSMARESPAAMTTAVFAIDSLLAFSTMTFLFFD